MPQIKPRVIVAALAIRLHLISPRHPLKYPQYDLLGTIVGSENATDNQLESMFCSDGAVQGTGAASGMSRLLRGYPQDGEGISKA